MRSLLQIESILFTTLCTILTCTYFPLPPMELHDQKKKKNFWSFLEEEDHRGLHAPSHPLSSRSTHKPDTDPPSAFELPRALSAKASSLAASPCGSPWTLSPPRRRLPSLKLSPPPIYHCLATLQRHDGNVLSVAVADGLVFTGSESDRVRMWKQPNCVDRGHIRTGHGQIRAMLAHGNGLFTAHKDRRVREWNVSSPSSGPSEHVLSKKIATFPARTLFRIRTSPHRHEDAITCLALYLREGLLYSGSADRTVKVWKITQSRCIDCFAAHEGQVSAMAVNQEDGSLFTGSSDGTVKVWRRVYGDHSHAVVMVLRFQPSPVNALVLGSAHFLYSGSSDGYVNVWEKEEMVSGRYRHGGFLQGHKFAVLCLVAEGRLVLSGSEDATIRVWRREECGIHVCVAVMKGHRGPVRCMAASVEMEGEEGEGLLLYSASLDRMVKVWRVKVAGKPKSKDEVEEEEMEPMVVTGYEMNPVLSPLWVEKKRIHGGTSYLLG